MISLAVTQGNPLFAKIPDIISEVKESYQEELVEHLKYATLIELGHESAGWIKEHYSLINECTFRLCRGFAQRAVNSEYRAPSLDIHLLAEVEDVKIFSNVTGWLIRFSNCFALLKEIAFKNKEARLTENEYNKFTFAICQGNNDELLAKFND